MNRSVIRGLGLLPIVFLSACVNLGPDFETPEAPVADDWMEAEQAGVNYQATDDPEWWRVFNDPVLDRLIDTARSQNLSLRSAGLRVLQANAQLGIATGRKFPQVQQITGSASNINISENGNDNISLLENNFALYNLDFGLSWEVDFWGRFRRMVESESALLQAEMAGYNAMMVSLSAEVAHAYVLLRTLQERIALAEQNVTVQERTHKIADVKHRNGQVTELDVQQALTILNRTRATIPPLQTSLNQVRNVLSVLLGILPQELGAVLDESGTMPAPPAEIAVGMPQDLIRRRPDIRRAEWMLAAQSAQIGVAVTELYPHFNIGGSIGVATTDINGKSASDIFDSDSINSLLFGGFTWSVFNYGTLKNNVRFQDARFQELLVDYQNLVLSAQAEVDDAIFAYLQAHAQAQHLTESVAAAERSVELSLIQYREGSADFNQVLSTLTQQTEQQDALTATNGTIAADLVTIYKVLGGGWEVGAERSIEDFLSEQDKQELRSRTKYWRNILAE